MNFIVDPNTLISYHINSYNGLHILKNYVKLYQTGGSSESANDDAEIFSDEEIIEVMKSEPIGAGENGKVYDMEKYILKVGHITHREIEIQKYVYNKTKLTPNIVQYGEVNIIRNGNIKPIMYIIMDKIVGQTLNDIYESKKKTDSLSDEEQLKFKQSLKDQVIKSISKLLKIKICHADITGNNIMFGYNMGDPDMKKQWFIIDWGQSWIMNSEIICEDITEADKHKCGLQGEYQHCRLANALWEPGKVCSSHTCIDDDIEFEDDIY
jgi:serine/threonine protein kinase